MKSAVSPPLALYVHFPWCVHKCPYCDFNSHELSNPPRQRYLAALFADLESQLPWVWGREVRSIFIGGGTPSLMGSDTIAQLLSGLRQRLPMSADAEITMEANPGTVEHSPLAQYREAGVNRLSLGIQSLGDVQLKSLERIHDRAQALWAMEQARSAFDNFNLDLMHGLPQQSLEQALEDVEQALEYGPTHLSCYQLTLEPHTRFHRNPPPLPNHDLVAEMGEAIEVRLQQRGFQHYEVSAYAQPGKASRHNLNYWGFGDYLGIGAGAHGKLTGPWGRFRTWRLAHPEQYMNALEQPAPTVSPVFDNLLPGLPQASPIPNADLPFEFAMNALRLIQGFPLEWFEARTGLPRSQLMPALELAQQNGWIEQRGEWILPTLMGQRFLNDLVGLFLP